MLRFVNTKRNENSESEDRKNARKRTYLLCGHGEWIGELPAMHSVGSKPALLMLLGLGVQVTSTSGSGDGGVAGKYSEAWWRRSAAFGD